ncbi:MAG TPA: vitamin K epoxide reductase family protein [Acidimicrobiia bacterium]|nr:vitamin K epoxide reductase family protein [Acidimicrobiia bacterium]
MSALRRRLVRICALTGALVAMLIVPAGVALAADDSAPSIAIDEPWFSVGDDGVTRVVLWFAYSSTCSHCQAAAPWVTSLDELGWVETRWLQMNGEDQAPGQLAVELAASIGGDIRYVPTFMYCGVLESGFDQPETTGVILQSHLEACRDAVLEGGAVVPPVTPPAEGHDELGDVVGGGVLAVLIASLVTAPILALRRRLHRGPLSLVFLLGLVGAGIAAYLTHVETTGTEAVCGPVGNCNVVQQSGWARLFGVIPVGVIGLIGFGTVLALLVIVVVGRPSVSDWARTALGVGAVAGVAFSVYLTILELFVIRAVCAWCLTSALIAAGLMWVTIGPAADAWRRVRDRGLPGTAAHPVVS